MATTRDMIGQRAYRNARGALSALLYSEALRPLRFVLTGGSAGLMQLALLALLLQHGWQEGLANGTAFLLAAQLNFVLSSIFTWSDRSTAGGVGRRWLAFHGSIATMAVVNMVTFALARTMLPTLLASAMGITVAAIGNFIIGDRLVFRHPTSAMGDAV